MKDSGGDGSDVSFLSFGYNYLSLGCLSLGFRSLRCLNLGCLIFGLECWLSESWLLECTVQKPLVGVPNTLRWVARSLAW